jgi:hypothetical protein
MLRFRRKRRQAAKLARLMVALDAAAGDRPAGRRL